MTWRDHRVSEMARLINGTPFAAESFDSVGEVPLVRIRDLSATDFDTFVPNSVVPAEAFINNGDVLIGMDGDFNVLRWQRGGAALNQRVCLLRGNDQCDSRFLAYSLPPHLKKINDLTYSTTVKHLSSKQVQGIRIQAPALKEQRAIADYLDRETQKIDELIAEQRGLIEKLSERRRSLVTRLVTRGIDDNVEMAEVPNKWLDFVPMQWKVTRFRFVAKIDNAMVDPKDARFMHDVLIAPNHVESDTGRLLAIETADEQGSDSNKFRVREGQIIYSKIRPTLNKAVVAPCDCLCSADMYPISFDSVRVSTRYALYQMLSRPIHDYVTERSMRVKMPKVNREELADLPWLLPPVEVQEEISDEIDEQTSRIDELIAESEELIALSQERRAALITAAVTGQIDVRTAT